jgi:hypothetical protein
VAGPVGRVAEVSQATLPPLGPRCYFLLCGVPSSLQWGSLPAIASTGSHRKPVQLWSNTSALGWLHPVDQVFLDLPSQLLLMPCLKWTSRVALLYWEMADHSRGLWQLAFCGIALVAWASSSQLHIEGFILQLLSNPMLISSKQMSKEEGPSLVL